MLRDWKVYPGFPTPLVNGFPWSISILLLPALLLIFGWQALTPEKHMGRKVTDMLVLAWGEPELAQNCLLHLCLKSERSQGYVAQYIRIICDSHTVPRLLNLEMSPDNGIASSMPVTFMYSSACTQPKAHEGCGPMGRGCGLGNCLLSSTMVILKQVVHRVLWEERCSSLITIFYRCSNWGSGESSDHSNLDDRNPAVHLAGQSCPLLGEGKSQRSQVLGISGTPSVTDRQSRW